MGDVCSGFVDLTARPRFYVGQAEVFGSQKVGELTRSAGSKTLLVTLLLFVEAKRLGFAKTMRALHILSAFCLMRFIFLHCRHLHNLQQA